MDESRHEELKPDAIVRPPRRQVRVLLLAIVGVLAVFVTGLTAGVVVGQVLIYPTPATAVESSQVPSVLKEAWALVHERYVDPSKINDQKMIDGAITGMLDTLGDQGHTRYLPKDQVAQQNESLSGSYVGVGIQVEARNNAIVVVAPIDNSPAQRAGIRAGDVLTSVNGQSVAGMSLDQAVQLVRGPEGSTVNLVFQRPGVDTPVSVSLTRTKLEVASVDWVMLPNQVADVRIREFSRGTSAQLAKAIQAAQQQGATGIILDLRNNPGGLVDEAIGVASEFLPPDTPVFISQVRDGSKTVYRSQANATRTDLPMVVLVDKGTASASEIVSGALQGNRRAKIIGEPTFGTGTVLSQFGLSDGSALLLGTELWLTPDGQLIKDRGITPDYKVSLAQDVAPFVPTGSQASADALQKDVQVQAGLSVLRGDPLPSGALPVGTNCLRCS